MWQDGFQAATKNWPDSVKRKFIEHALRVQIFAVHSVEIDEPAPAELLGS